MQNEFKFGGEKVEVTVAKNDEIWSLGEYSGQIVGDGRILITAADGQARFAHSAKVGDTWWVHFDGHIFCIEKTEPGSTDNDSDGGMVAPMPGKILDVKIANGDNVAAGQLLLIMEAMKMESEVKSPHSGKIKNIHVNSGDAIKSGDLLITLE